MDFAHISGGYDSMCSHDPVVHFQSITADILSSGGYDYTVSAQCIPEYSTDIAHIVGGDDSMCSFRSSGASQTKEVTPQGRLLLTFEMAVVIKFRSRVSLGYGDSGGKSVRRF